MLIPRFSLRLYFVATVVLALFSIAAGYAVEGQAWARGLVVGILSAVGAFGLYALVFAVTWGFVERYAAKHAARPASPFAGEEPPEQVFPPIEM